MERTKICFTSALILALLFFTASVARAQIDIGNFSISGSAEVGGLPRHKNGADARFEEYRDLPENAIVPQLQLMIGGKKEDFYLNFDSSKVGLDDQNYLLRFGRYGLMDVEFEWNQIPHLFDRGYAKTPYARSDGIFTLSSKPTAISSSGAGINTWVNDNANLLNLSLFTGVGKVKLRYTPTPGWTFTSSYWSQNTAGKRAFGTLTGAFGSDAGNSRRANITELSEPIDYQSHNIELGGEYAGDGWSVGLRYNASLFHNNVSTLVWDNYNNISGTGSACSDAANYFASSNGNDANRGPCRGRIDLYPSNQAHTWTLSGATKLPFKSNFMGTVSYGMRLQNDPFLPFTINSAVTQPGISRSSLDGDVRPTMVNATLVNRYFDHLDLKAYYRLFDYDNRSKKVFLPDGFVLNDQAFNGNTYAEAGLRTFPNAYSKQNVGLDAGYEITRWLNAKMGYGFERMHRERREVLNADEHTLGPTFDIKPNSWSLFRVAYKHSWRYAGNYDAGRRVVIDTEETADEIRSSSLSSLRKLDEARRDRDKVGLFTQFTPWEKLTLYGGFDFTADDFPNSHIGIQSDINYSPSIGLAYMPADWIKIFTDYNWERFDWGMRAMQRTSAEEPFVPGSLRIWTSRGKDEINTFSIGSDMDLIQKLLGFRLQYGYSLGRSEVHASGATCSGCTAATNYPTITNSWHELLARFEYQVHKNVALRFGYYFNHATEHDIGVDIMRLWMGNVDRSGANPSRPYDIFLGDRIKGPFTAHVGFLSMRLSF